MSVSSLSLTLGETSQGNGGALVRGLVDIFLNSFLSVCHFAAQIQDSFPRTESMDMLLARWK